jgi:hypothetical protein
MRTGDVVWIGDIFLLVGLALATVGGILLAYDGLHGAGAQFQAQVSATKLENFLAFRAESQAFIRGLPEQYSKEKKEALLTEEKEKYEPQQQQLARNAGSIDSTYKDKVVGITLRGIRLLIAAFVLQFIGTLIIALEHAS